MSDLRPKGVMVTIGEGEHELLFTIGVIENIQNDTGLPLFDAMQMMAKAVDGNTSNEVLKCYKKVLTALTGKPEEEFNSIRWDEYSKIARKTLEAFGISLPEPDEDEEDNDDEEDPKRAAEA